MTLKDIYEEYAATLGKEIDELSRHERQLVFINAILSGVELDEPGLTLINGWDQYIKAVLDNG